MIKIQSFDRELTPLHLFLYFFWYGRIILITRITSKKYYS
jgi:hypothetical protein